MDKVTLNREQRAEAMAWADKVRGKIEPTGPNYTGLTTPDRFIAGRFGEVAFMLWAKDRFVDFEETSRSDGRPDQQDFFVWTKDERKLKLNVKNSLHPRARKLMQPVAQARRHDADLYLGCTSIDYETDVEVTLHGVVTKAYWKAHRSRENVKVNTYTLPLAELNVSMEEFYQNVRLGADERAIWLADYDRELAAQGEALG